MFTLYILIPSSSQVSSPHKRMFDANVSKSCNRCKAHIKGFSFFYNLLTFFIKIQPFLKSFRFQYVKELIISPQKRPFFWTPHHIPATIVMPDSIGHLWNLSARSGAGRLKLIKFNNYLMYSLEPPA